MTTFWILLAVAVIYFGSLGWRARREQNKQGKNGAVRPAPRLDTVVCEIAVIEHDMRSRGFTPIDYHERLVGGAFGPEWGN